MGNYFTEKEIKVRNKAYDSMYDLNSKSNYKYDDVIQKMNKEALEKGYYYKLDNNKQKFYLKKMDNPKESPYYKGN